VCSVTTAGIRVFSTLKGKSHQRLAVWLGPRALHVFIGRWHHLLHWGGGRLEIRSSALKQPGISLKHPELLGLVPANGAGLPRFVAYDRHRFVEGARKALTIAVDTFGQIAVFDARGMLLCMFFVFRHQVATWMPDGTRYGPAELTGGPATAGAKEKIGRV